MMRLFLLFVSAGLVLGQRTPAVEQIDKLFSEFTRPDSPGCAIGVMRGGELVFARGYGLANVEHAVPITPATVFDIGSVSKQFTATAVLMLAEEGKLSLDDDIRKFIPELPDYGKKITVRHLLHHTSGIRDYLTLMRLSGVQPDGVTDDADALRLITRQKALNFNPGEEFLYSNSGYFLLSVIVQRASGRSLREYAQEKVFGPLGMKSTMFRDDHTQVLPHRASAYSRKELTGYRIAMSGFEQTGDGAVHTSIEDLLAWENNFYEPHIGSEALYRELATPGVLNNGRKLEYAMGLMVGEHRGLKTVFHGGSWAGYRAEILRFPELRLSVACLCNLAQSNPTQLVRQVADLYVARPVESKAAASEPAKPAPADAVTPTEADMRSCEGVYGDAAHSSFRKVRLVGGKLEVETYGFGRYPMRAVGPGRYRLLEIPFDIEMTFQPAANEGRRYVEISRDGKVSEKLPLLASLTEPVPPLGEYVGVYESDELATRFAVTLDRDGLSIAPVSAKPPRFEPVADDNFVMPGVHVRFVRDANKRIRGFEINAGRVRGIAASRVSFRGPHGDGI